MGYSQEEWTPLLIHEKGPVTGMPSPIIQKDQKQIKLIKQNSPRVVVSWRHSFFQASHVLMLVGGRGSIKLYLSVWEPPIMCVAWKISPSLGCYVDSESMPLKMLFISISKLSYGTSTNPYFPLRRAYLLLYVFYFMQESR